jgi:hypothetical protein
MSNEKGKSRRGFDQADSEQTGQYPGGKRGAQYSSIGDEWYPSHERVLRYGVEISSRAASTLNIVDALNHGPAVGRHRMAWHGTEVVTADMPWH